jgi:hypothetical protein
MEWQREHARLTPAERDAAVNDLIDLAGAVDGILQAQSAADADYFVSLCDRRFTDEESAAIRAGVLKAYRYQYIITGVMHPHFGRLLTGMTTPAQMQRIQAALAPICG